MINSKKIHPIHIDRDIYGSSYRSSAFWVYKNLLNTFDSNELFLLESLGASSIDSRASLIGINPVFRIEVFDRMVTVSGNEQLLKRVRLLYAGESLVESSKDVLRFELASRTGVWDFLRLLDAEFDGVVGGVMAFTVFSYNTVYFIEEIPGYLQGEIPDICLVCYSTYIEFEENHVTLYEYEFLGVDSLNLSKIESCFSLKEVTTPTFSKNHFEINRETLKSDYLNKAILALNHVKVGDVYQIQVGQKITIRSDISTLDVYSRLRFLNPSPYMYLFDCDRFKVVGASPELFVYMKDDEVVMRPIAGTLGKAAVRTREDAKNEFYQNSKEIAEHMMLVDLCRNDLSRISLPQSLEVSELMSVEEYSHVYHMTSTAKSRVKKDCDKWDVLRASFPAGTMTGTPKIRAIELISQIEDSGRGLYAGALGVIGLGVDFLNTALCIRTAIQCNSVFTLRASAGIVADSVVENEYAETLQKMGSVFKAITNEEISCHLV